MQLREVGRSGVKVSALALGTMNFGSDWHGSGRVDDRTADALVGAALDAGVNLIDTADVYGYGAAESVLGKILRGRRAKLLLATKVCGEMRPGDPSSGGLSARHISAALNASLKRLKTDHVDLYMAHAPDPRVPIDETLEAFGRAVKDGKVRVAGCSNFNGAEVVGALERSDGKIRPRLEFDQVQYSLAARFVESDLVPAASALGVSLIAWSPLGGGFLTGKYSGSERPAGRRKEQAAAFPSIPEGRLAGAVKVLTQVARLEGVSPAQAALGWALSRPWLASAVVGARSLDQLRETLAAFPLPERSVAILDKASALCLGL